MECRYFAAIMFFVGFLTGGIYVMSNSVPQYQAIASNVASEHNYTPSYVCANFSQDLTQALRAEGYFAMEKTVKIKDYNGLHGIILLILPIESTNGTILVPDKWKEGGYSFFGVATDCQRCMKELE